MPGTQVRINHETHKVLRSLAAEEGESMQSIIEEAVELYKRRKFLEGLNEDFKRLKNNPEAWQDELEERRMWESTLADDLDDE